MQGCGSGWPPSGAPNAPASQWQAAANGPDAVTSSTHDSDGVPARIWAPGAGGIAETSRAPGRPGPGAARRVDATVTRVPADSDSDGARGF